MPELPASFLRPDLGILVSETLLNDRRYIATTLFPEMMVGAISDTFTRADAKVGTQAPDTRYAGGRPKSGNLTVAEDSYKTQRHAWEQGLDDGDRGKARGRFDVEKMCSMIPAGILASSLEREAEGVLNNNTNFPLSGTTGATAVVPWSTHATSTPIDDVLAGVEAIYDKTGGLTPDTMVLPWRAWKNFSRSSQVLDQIKYVDAAVKSGVLEGTVLNSMLQVPRILIPGAVKDTANQGLPAALTPIWNKDYVHLMVTAPSGLDTSGNRISAAMEGVAQIGRTFSYTDESWGGGILSIYQHRIAEEYRDLFHAIGNWQVKLFSNKFGYRLKIAA